MRQLDEKEQESGSQTYVWKPEILPANASATQQRIQDLTEAGRVWRVVDTVPDQLGDLLSARDPKQKSDIAKLPIRDLLARYKLVNSIDAVGNWVYYPWSGLLVHLLPADEFHELRLDRNRPKITEDEQRKFKNLNIGIVGLSVGNAVAVTLALEGVCGHLKLADFDSLDLSNMNRLRATVSDINVPKTILVARQILEINPYASISLYHEGVSAANVDKFLVGKPALDVVIDECDDISMKILLREKARERRIPVLMETSDRGMLDVERFDLEAKREIFHGLLPGVKSSDVPPTLSSEEKVDFVLPLLGTNDMSVRAAASMFEISDTLSSWPQLASDVALGGASVCTAVRRIALGQELPSGRSYVDLEKIFTKEVQEKLVAAEIEKVNHNAEVAGVSSDFQSIPEFIRDLVAEAIKAPTAGNMQQWKFSYHKKALWVSIDEVRAKSILDFQLRAACLGVGAAIENIVISAPYKGYAAQVEWLPEKGRQDIVAKISFKAQSSFTRTDELYQQIDYRETNRHKVKSQTIEESELQCLRDIAKDLECELQICADRSQLHNVAHHIGVGDRIRFLNPELHEEMMHEMRWNRQQAEVSGDGIDVATLEMPAPQIMALKMLARPMVARFLRSLKAGNSLAKISEESANAYPAIGLLSSRGNSVLDYVRAGRAMQRVWLKTTQFGIALQPRAVLTYMFDMANDELASKCFSPEESSTLKGLDHQFSEVFPADSNNTRLFLFGLGYKSDLAVTTRSMRIPVERVLDCKRP